MPVEIKFFEPGTNIVQNIAKGEMVFNKEIGRAEIISDDLIEVKSKHHLTGEIIYGYIHKNNQSVRTKVTMPSGRTQWESRTGYVGYANGCYYWGTLITGVNGESIFIPASGVNAILNPPMCEYWFA